jgi:hypothetical protein
MVEPFLGVEDAVRGLPGAGSHSDSPVRLMSTFVTGPVPDHAPR